MAKDLVTLEEYKAYAGITNPNQDGIISSLIPKVSALVKNICRRTFVDYLDDAKIERFNGGLGSTYYVKEYPILAVSSVQTSNDYGANYTDMVEFTDYAVDPEDHAVVSLATDGFAKKVNGYIVTYTAGYEVLPEDLRLAVMDLITYYIRNDMAVHSSKAPGTNTVQIEYVTTTNLPAHIKRILDLYTASYE